MNISAKNITSILALATVAFGGYYLYAQRSATVLDLGTQNEQKLQDMLANTQIFIEHSNELDRIQFNVGLFEDARFRSLQSFTKPVVDQPVGKSDPFSSAEYSFN